MIMMGRITFIGLWSRFLFRIRIRKGKGQKDNSDLQNTTQKTKARAPWTPLIKGWTQVHRKGKQFLFHWWHSLFYSSYKHGDKSSMWKGWQSAYDKWNNGLSIMFLSHPKHWL